MQELALIPREREKCYPHQARKAYLGSAMTLG